MSYFLTGFIEVIVNTSFRQSWNIDRTEPLVENPPNNCCQQESKQGSRIALSAAEIRKQLSRQLGQVRAEMPVARGKKTKSPREAGYTQAASIAA